MILISIINKYVSPTIITFFTFTIIDTSIKMYNRFHILTYTFCDRYAIPLSNLPCNLQACVLVSALLQRRALQFNKNDTCRHCKNGKFCQRFIILCKYNKMVVAVAVVVVVGGGEAGGRGVERGGGGG